MSIFSDDITRLAAEVIRLGADKGVMIAAAESCTGGLLTGALTDIPGSSAVVERGFVTYTNEAKADMLHVATTTLEQHGAVSDQTAAAMAEGAVIHSRAQLAVSLTGIAGPGGGSAQKPVGLVHFGVCGPHGTHVEHHVFSGERSEVRLQAVQYALSLLIHTLQEIES